MQLISCSPGLRIDIRAERANYTPTGHPLPTTPQLFVQFYNGGSVPRHIIERVEELPGFRQGIGRDEDPYLTRVGWWDSIVAQDDYGWSDEDREYVEQRILQIGDPNVLLITEARVEAPYAKYDDHRRKQGKRTLEHVLADIGSTFELAGFDVGQAVAYEKQNGNDPKVLEFLGGLGSPVAEDSEELVKA